MNYEQELKEAEKILKENSIPTDYLKETFADHYEQKAKIHAAAGLTPENDYKIILPLTKTLESCIDLKRLIRSAIDNDPDYALLDLTFLKHLKQTVKITKYLNKNYERLIQSDSFIYHASCAGFTPELSENTRRAFLIWYGEQSINGRLGIISGTALDLITASHNASYCSCIRPDGEYFNTVLSYLASDNVLISYITDQTRKDYKIGRQLIFITAHRIAQLRQYGTFPDEDSRLIRLKIQENLTGDWIKRKEPLKTEDVIYYGHGYIDYGYGTYSFIKNTDHEKFTIEKGKCLSCNYNLDRPDQGACSNCTDDRFTCISCENQFNLDDRHTNQDGDEYCDECYHAAYWRCDRCECETSNDNGFCIRTGTRRNEEYICESCFEDHGATCESCGNNFYSDNMIESDGEWYCQDCAADELSQCEECGDTVKNDEIEEINGSYYCTECAMNFIECAECENMVLKEDTKEIDSKIYCDECANETAPLQFEERQTV